jgi:tRNA(fMet)-specific endonuclease VapC
LILDTNGLSAMAEGDAELGPILQRARQLAIPAIVLGEYRFGIRQSRHRARYERWLSSAMAHCRLLPIDEDTAVEYAEIRYELKKNGRPIPGNDLWIAALARQHALPLISRDSHFDAVTGVVRINW